MHEMQEDKGHEDDWTSDWKYIRGDRIKAWFHCHEIRLNLRMILHPKSEVKTH